MTVPLRRGVAAFISASSSPELISASEMYGHSWSSKGSSKGIPSSAELESAPHMDGSTRAIGDSSSAVGAGG